MIETEANQWNAALSMRTTIFFSVAQTRRNSRARETGARHHAAAQGYH